MKIMLLTIVALMVVGCKKGEDPDPDPDPEYPARIFSETYIRMYSESDSLDCFYDYDAHDYGIFFNTACIIVRPYVNPRGPFYFPGSERFRELTDHFGDHYNGYVSAPYYGGIASANEFTSLDVISDQPFDAKHPAGTSLRDIAAVTFDSYYNFIKNGYDPRYLRWETKLASELLSTDLTLLGGHPVIGVRFTRPIPLGEHNFTVTLESADTTLTQTFPVYIE